MPRGSQPSVTYRSSQVDTGVGFHLTLRSLLVRGIVVHITSQLTTAGSKCLREDTKLLDLDRVRVIKQHHHTTQ